MEKKQKEGDGERAAAAARRWVIGVGFWVQGFRLFPWLGVNFFLKDGMGVAASSLQILQASANLPMVAKPLLGLLSDAVPIRGYRRLPYVAIGVNGPSELVNKRAARVIEVSWKPVEKTKNNKEIPEEKRMLQDFV